MTPSSARPLNKVTYGAIAAALAPVVLALLRHYVWTDMPADLEAPMSTLVLALIVGAASGITGYMTRLRPGEVKPADVRRHGTGA